ncbi:hypothetical protein ACFQI7_20380 [Paenibacillus allorhizosphaerae]|nr:hypothetical protein [Paenibacillus allorhizosphaerae]
MNKLMIILSTEPIVYTSLPPASRAGRSFFLAVRFVMVPDSQRAVG